MKINVLLNIGNKPSGAARPIIEFCNVLAKSNDILIYRAFNPNKKGLEYKLREITGFILRGKKFCPRWIRCDCPVVIIPSCREKFVRDADITFFRSAHLAQEVSAWSKSKGLKVMRVSNVHMLNNPVRIPENIVLIASSTMVYEKLKIIYPRHKIFKVGNGVNCGFFSYTERNRERARSIGMVFYGGKNSQHKGMEIGFEVMRRIKEKFPDMRFFVAGLKKEKQIPGFVEFISGLRSHDMLNFYNKVDILIYPSLEDAWPNPPMEAMACGCGVVTTEVGGIGEFVINGETAIVCKPGDIDEMTGAVELLIKNPEIWKKLINNGKEMIKQFDYPKQAEILERTFNEILSTA